MEASRGAAVRVVSRRMVRPATNGDDAPAPPSEEDIHLTPWDIRHISIDYIQKGILLPKPPAGGERLVDSLAASFARALGRYYHFAGRLAVEERADGTITVPLRCTGEGAEFVHAAAPGIAIADVVGSVFTPPVVWAFFSQNGMLNADAAIESLPVLSAQLTELADGVFLGISMNHAVGDGTAFWEFLNTWSEISRGGIRYDLREISTPSPAHRRWFIDTSPVPIPLPFSKLQHVVRRFELPPVQEAFLTFSAASVKKLKARANAEMSGTATATISSLQSVLAHLWQAVTQARRLSPGQETSYFLAIGCRGRVAGIPWQGYVGNAVVFARASSTAGEILDKGLGWTAWQLNRAVASFDEVETKEWLDRWTREPDFVYSSMGGGVGMTMVTGSSPRFDVFGNDFGWGKPVAVRTGRGTTMDGMATVFEGPERGGSMSLSVYVAPDVLERLVANNDFMESDFSTSEFLTKWTTSLDKLT